MTSVQKAGGGTWVLSGNSSYSGATTISGGTLVLSGEQSIPDSGTVNISAGTVQVEVREKVGVLTFDGVAQAIGSWESTDSPAQNKDDTYFSGTGILYVGIDFPPSGTVLLINE